MEESALYRALITASQRLSWFLGQALRLRFAVRAVYPQGPLRRRPGEALILALTHEHLFDPWLALVAFDYRTWRSLTPVRILGTQDWTGLYARIAPILRGLYRLYGVAMLPPRSRLAGREEKLRGLLDALARGDVVAIFPEGHVREPGEPPVRPFAPGVALLHRRSGAPVVPIAIHLVKPERGRRRFTLIVGAPVQVPEGLDIEETAEWLRRRTRERYEEPTPKRR